MNARGANSNIGVCIAKKGYDYGSERPKKVSPSKRNQDRLI